MTSSPLPSPAAPVRRPASLRLSPLVLVALLVAALAGLPVASVGFNLLVGDRDRLGYLSNRTAPGSAPHWLGPGIYGLSNHLLDTPWPKLTTAKAAFTDALAHLPETQEFFRLLADDEIVPDPGLPDTGVPLAWERMLSAVFVKSPDYGTRASSLLMRHRDGTTTLIEHGFGGNRQSLGENRQTFYAR